MANLSNINGKFVVEQTTGYVGVGTTDPNYPIEVLNASAEIALNASGGSIYRVQSDSASNFIIRKEGVGDRLVINSAGNATFSGTVETTTLRTDVVNNKANSANIIYRSGTDTLVGGGGLTAKVYIQDGGNVGIGTDSPDLGGVAGTRVLTIASPTAERWGILELAGNRTWGGNQVGELKFISTDATNNGTLVSLTAINDPTATGTGGSLKFSTRNNGGSLTERMHIDSSGNVTVNNGGFFLNKSDGAYMVLKHNNSLKGYLGIANQVITGGSTGDIGLTATSNLVFGSGGTTERMRIDSSGHVGIGITPQTTLADFCSIELGNIGQITSEKADSQYNSISISGNAYYDGGWKYKTASVPGANYISLYQGKIFFTTAPAPTTAGDAITFSNILELGSDTILGTPNGNQRLKITSGNFQIGPLIYKYPYYRVDSFKSDGSGYFWAFGHEKNDGTQSIGMMLNDGVSGNKYTRIINTLQIASFTSNEYNGAYPSFQTNVVLRNSGNSYLNGGNVSVGDTVAQRKFNVIDPTDAWIRISASNYASDWLIGTAGSSASFKIYSQSAAALRFNIDGIGRMGFNYGIENDTRHMFYSNNDTSAATGVAKNVQVRSTQYAGTHIAFRGSAGYSGTISYSGTTTNYNATSDYRLKEDLQNFVGLDMISKIPVYDFKWKLDKSRSYGVMAHELQEVLPDAVSGEKDAEEMQGVDYSKIVPLLVKSIQELKADNDSLKARIETLENN